MESSRLGEVADDVKARRRGRKPTDKSTPEQRAQWKVERDQKRQRAKAPDPNAEPERPPYQPTEESIVLCSVLGNVLWNLSRIFSHHRVLTQPEQRQLGEALDPVFWKYLPALDAWKAEATLVMVVWLLWQSTTPEPVEEDGAEPSHGGDRQEGLGKIDLGPGTGGRTPPGDRH